MIGKATLRALVAASSLGGGPKMEICAAVQNPSELNVEGLSQEFALPSVFSDSAVATDDSPAASHMGGTTNNDEEEWTSLFKDFQRIFLVTPKTQDPVPFTQSVLHAASKMNHLKLLLMTSSILVGTNSTAVGRQSCALEEFAKAQLGKKYCIARIPSSPFWLDYLSVYASQIRDNHSLLDPRDANKPFWSVALGDIANCCSTILSAPSDGDQEGNLLKYQQQTFDLVSTSPWNLHHLASVLTQKLGMDSPIQTTRVSYDDTKKGMMKYGMPEWQVDSVLEMFHSIDNPENDGVVASAVELISGQKATTLEEWIDKNLSVFTQTT